MKNISYGAVFINSGPHKGRVGYYDNDCDDNDDGLVCFGDPMLVANYYRIKQNSMSQITTHSLVNRSNAIQNRLSAYSENYLKGKTRVDLLEELVLINNLLADRMFTARFTKITKKSTIFISHSSKDKQFARWISVDLKNAGYSVWLDEWSILVGESIPKKIETGIEKCNFVIVVLSKNSVKSQWVEREWHLKYWDEVEKKLIFVLPVLKEKCKIPGLLKTKRYADFTDDYTQGLEDLMFAIKNTNGKK